MGYYADLIKEKQNKDDTQWITTKTGRHIPIEPGETKKEAVEKAFGESKEKSKQEPSKSKIKGLDVKDQDGKQPEEGMWLFKPMSHNTFRGDVKLNLFKVKVRKKKSGESEAYLSTPNGLITKGMSHVKGGKLFDSEEEARKYAESQKTPEEKEYDKKTTWERVEHHLEKQHSKGADMNYYAKLAEEKKNSVVKKGTLSGGNRYEIKKERESFSTTGFSYIGYVYDSINDNVYKTSPCDSIEKCERDIMQHKTFKAYNAKEKSNSVVTRGTIHGHKYEVERMSDGSYMGYVYDEEDYPIFKTSLHSTSSGAEQEIKSKVFNSKEKSNWKVLDAEVMSYSDPDTHEKYYKVWLITDEGWRNPRVFKTFQEADREAARIQREVKSKNSKENDMNYYEKIIQEKKNNSNEEKDNENFHYLGKTFSVTSGNFQQVRQQVQKAYWDKVKELEVKLRSAEGSEKQRIEKELREIREGYRETMEDFDRFNNSKSYYQSIIEKKNQIDPEKEMKKLQALKPIVEAFKHKGMTKHEVATRLMQEKNISETLAQQCVDSWY